MAMGMIGMNNSKQVRIIYQVLKDGVGDKYKDFQILEYANALHGVFNEDFEGGYQYKPSFDEQCTKDVFSRMSSSNGELMHEEKELLNSVYEFDSYEFITNRAWEKINFGGCYEC